MSLGLAMAVSKPSKRRRRSGLPKPVPPDLGTEQTRARLQPAPWAEWSRELQEAAERIDEAVRLIAGASIAQAQNTARLAFAYAADWDADSPQGRRVSRYTWWRWEVVRRGWNVGKLVDTISDCTLRVDLDTLRDALELYAKQAHRHDGETLWSIPEARKRV